MKKQKLILLPLFALIMMTFVSCVDIVQVIDFKDGKYDFKIRVTFAKSLLALAETDLDDISSDLDFDEMPNEMKASIKIVDTEYDTGYDLDFSVDPKTADGDFSKILPKSQKNGKIRIPFFWDKEIADITSSSADPEYEAITYAMFSSAKYKIFLSKKIAPSISAAYISTKYGSTTVSSFEIGNFYCIETPIPEIKKDSSLVIEK